MSESQSGVVDRRRGSRIHVCFVPVVNDDYARHTDRVIYSVDSNGTVRLIERVEGKHHYPVAVSD